MKRLIRILVATLILHVLAAVKAAETSSLSAAASDRVSARPDLAITTLGFGSCAHEDRPVPIWDTINAAHCDAFVILGDNIYADTSDPAVFRQKYALLAATAGFAQDSAQSELKLDLLPNEAWWGGAVTLGTKMPFGVEPIDINLDGDNRGNQYAPLLVSSKGRYVWCEKAFRFEFKDKNLRATSAGNTFRYGQAGQNLRDAYRHASKSFFPTDAKLPDRALFATPQYNTWIELMYDQNQRDVLKYAHAIVDNGLPPGVLMIDDNWQEDYGKWTFHPGCFPDPKAMMNELHALGFKVMVWVCPFVSPDCDVYRALARKKAFFMDQPGDPAMVKWWNGNSAMLDLSNPAAKAWFTGELTRLQTTCGVDGFKLDAGDTAFYKAQYLAHEKLDANEHARLFGEIGLAFPLNEYRATWKLAGRPLVQRLRDKSHNWADLEQLIPDMIAAGLMGYTFVCPDLIGGGEFTSFLDQATIDQDLIVRSAQVHALAPMMQFSVAPWRVLDAAHLAAVKQAVALRMRFTPRILELAQASAATDEPILRPLAYVFPDGGYENVKDQFLMGDDLLVAPMVTKGTARTAQMPSGQWKANDGTLITGPIQKPSPSRSVVCFTSSDSNVHEQGIGSGAGLCHTVVR